MTGGVKPRRSRSSLPSASYDTLCSQYGLFANTHTPARSATRRTRSRRALVAAIAAGPRHCGGSEPARRSLHHSVPERRAPASRHVGHEARGAAGDSRRVQPDSDVAAGLLHGRTAAADGPACPPVDRRAVDASQREQRARGGRLLRLDRPRPRRARRRREGNRQPGPRQRAVDAPPAAADDCPLRPSAVHHQRRGRGPAAARPSSEGFWAVLSTRCS